MYVEPEVGERSPLHEHRALPEAAEEAAPGAGVQKIPIVGEAVEVTEPDFTKSAAPEPRTVTVEELRARLCAAFYMLSDKASGTPDRKHGVLPL